MKWEGGLTPSREPILSHPKFVSRRVMWHRFPWQPGWRAVWISLWSRKMPHMPTSNLEIKARMQTCNRSLCRCNELISDHLARSSWGLVKVWLLYMLPDEKYRKALNWHKMEHLSKIKKNRNEKLKLISECLIILEYFPWVSCHEGQVTRWPQNRLKIESIPFLVNSQQH